MAGQYTERRGFANPDRGMPQILHSEPYLAADLYLFDGNANQVVYVVPSQDLVILRTGLPPLRDENTEWDNSYLPNTIIRGIIRDQRPPAPQRQALTVASSPLSPAPPQQKPGREQRREEQARHKHDQTAG